MCFFLLLKVLKLTYNTGFQHSIFIQTSHCSLPRYSSCPPLFPLPGCLFLIGVVGHIIQASLELAALFMPLLAEHCDLLSLEACTMAPSMHASDLLELVSKSCMRSKYRVLCIRVCMCICGRTHPPLFLKFVSFTNLLF